MAKGKLVTFRVSFRLPESATVADARDYVESAVAEMHGCLQPHGDEPGHPMSDLDGDTVRVTQLHQKKRAEGTRR